MDTASICDARTSQFVIGTPYLKLVPRVSPVPSNFRYMHINPSPKALSTLLLFLKLLPINSHWFFFGEKNRKMKIVNNFSPK